MWLVRHAPPLLPAGLCYGAMDVAADALATQRSAQELANTLPPGLVLRTSPLQRCKLLARSLKGLRPDLLLEEDARLVEMDFGCYEGQRWDQISRAALDAWTADFWHHRFGGAQSVSELMQRVAAVWDEAVRCGEPCVWITHAGVIRAATLLAAGVRQVNDAAQWPSQTLAFGQWLTLPLPAVGNAR